MKFSDVGVCVGVGVACVWITFNYNFPHRQKSLQLKKTKIMTSNTRTIFWSKNAALFQDEMSVLSDSFKFIVYLKFDTLVFGWGWMNFC